jgi:hypothetical protein
MNYIDYFINSKKPLVRPRPVVVEEDYELVCNVFPEPGFRSYFFGYIISKLASDLRKNGITNYTDRESRPEFPTFTRLLSDIVIIREETFANERRRVGGAYEEGARSTRKPADTPESLASEVNKGKERKRDEEA